jgi:hypothetical protein
VAYRPPNHEFAAADGQKVWEGRSKITPWAAKKWKTKRRKKDMVFKNFGHFDRSWNFGTAEF